MLDFLFSANGRISRAKFWSALIYYIVGTLIVTALFYVLWMIVPGTIADDGSFSVTGVAAIPYVVLSIAYLAAMVWSGVCIGVKRYHDRGKSGVWILIQFVPVIGALWYFIEAGCLRGTLGPNRYGADPVAG